MLRRLASVVLVLTAIVYGALDPLGPPETTSPPADALRIVTWNLRNFPVGPDDEPGAHVDPPHDLDRLAAVIDDLQPDVLALQEVRDVAAIAGLLRPAFEVTASQYGGPRGQHLVLAWRVARIRPAGAPVEHDAIALGGRLRPALSLRLTAQRWPRAFTVMAVHLKARPQGAPLRVKQWDRLSTAVERRLDGDHDGPPDLLLVGDFNVTGGTPFGSAADERRALETRLSAARLTPVEVGACTSYWHGVRHDRWVEPARLDLVFAAGFADVRANAWVGTHCRRHRCGAFAEPNLDPSFAHLSDHCPVVVDMIQNAGVGDPRPRTRD